MDYFGIMNLVDCHCHLWADSLLPNLEEVLNRSRAQGIRGWWVCGTNPTDWEKVLNLTLIPGMVGFVGVHPWYIPEGPESLWLDTLEKTLKHRKDLMIGEVGLDRTAGPSLGIQERVFIPQIQLSKNLRRCLNIHGRKTWDRVQLLLKRYGDPQIPSILHSFSGTVAEAHSLLDRGCYFSFSGSITRDRNQRLPITLKSLPLDRVLIETDAPDILPQSSWREDPHQPNESAFMIQTLNRMAEILNMAPGILGERLGENARRILNNLQE